MPITAEQLAITFKVRHTPELYQGYTAKVRKWVLPSTLEELIQGIAPGQFWPFIIRTFHLLRLSLITYRARYKFTSYI